MDRPFTADQAVEQIIAHMDRCNGDYVDWSASMTPNPERELFEYHRVEPRGQYVYCRCATFRDARFALDQLSDRYGVHIGPAWGSADALYVYAYKRGSRTRD